MKSAEQRIKEGFNDYYEGVSYAKESNVYWHQGWIAAERKSVCGRFDKFGKAKKWFG